MKATKDQIKGGLWGLITGDALGVPVEFSSRLELKRQPITGMIGNGTYSQPSGTWSDDSSMMLCTAESLLKGYDLHDIANSFLEWYLHAKWTPHGVVFDVGGTTSAALERLQETGDPYTSGLTDEQSNGNGSLMRILPLAFVLIGYDEEEKYRIISEVSAITHAHLRSRLACYIYVSYVQKLIELGDKFAAYVQMCGQARDFLKNKIEEDEYSHFYRILENDISTFPESEIYSSGYVVYTLEASLWSFLVTDSYEEAVLTAVNLGEDTDTTGAVTGGMAGLYYGYDSIPQSWLSQLARREDLEKLIEAFADKYGREE